MFRFVAFILLISFTNGQNWNTQSQIQQMAGGFPASGYPAGVMMDPSFGYATSPMTAAAVPITANDVAVAELYPEETLAGRRFLGNPYLGGSMLMGGSALLGPPILTGPPLFGSPLYNRGLGMPYPYYGRMYDEIE